jgi:prepilin-type N-terminal cleavage/methylation domain-containing protein
MSSDPAARRGREGFTLVEVLVAMVILAIGLLALEAMGIGAARAVARADVQSEYTAMATARVEETLVRIRQGQQLNQGVVPLAGGGTMTTIVVPTTVGGRQTFAVTVTVAPPSNPRLNLQPVTLVAREILD